MVIGTMIAAPTDDASAAMMSAEPTTSATIRYTMLPMVRLE
jgi:hypothetical protein